LISSASRAVSVRGITSPNERSVPRSLRVATRIWWTASGSSRRTLGSSE
jgi:hypothetical protein